MIRDRDYIKDVNGNILRVVGDTHPQEKIISFVKYYPSNEGCREVNNIKFQYNTFASRSLLVMSDVEQRVTYSNVVGGVVTVTPKANIIEHFSCRAKAKYILNNPSEYLSHPIGKYLVEYLEEISKIVDVGEVGVTGSFLFDFQNNKSDIDLVSYGRNAYEKLLYFYKNSKFIQGYEDGLQDVIYKRRMTHMAEVGAETLMLQEARKLQGVIRGTDIHINCQPLRKDNQLLNLGDIVDLGEVKCKLKIVDDSEGIYSPAIYKIEILEIMSSDFLMRSFGEKIKWLLSYIGDFAQTFRNGDNLYVEGKLIRMGDSAYGVETTSWNTEKRYKAYIIH